MIPSGVKVFLANHLRAECLNARQFLILADSREKLETWHRHYLHSAIGYKAAILLHNTGGDTSQPS